MKAFNIRNVIPVLSASAVCSTLISCSTISDFRKPTSQWDNDGKAAKKSEVSEADKAKAKEKLAQAETIGTIKKKRVADSQVVDSVATMSESVPDFSNVNRPNNMDALPAPIKRTGLLEPEVDDIPTNEELEEVEAPAPTLIPPRVTIPNRQ